MGPDGIGYVIEFDHKIDTDTINAGGFIEMNIDNDSIYYKSNGDTLTTWWLRILLNSELDLDESYGFQGGYGYYLITDNSDTVEMKDVVLGDDGFVTYMGGYYHKIYGYQDSLYNDVNGFTGTYDDYQNFYMDFMFAEGGVKTQDVNDTLNFRFHFISDGTSGGKNGWAIRNIKTGYSVHPTGNIEENNSNTNQIKVYPNPTNNITTATINNTENKMVAIEIYAIDGRKIETITRVGSKLNFDVSKYETGTYIFKYFIEQELVAYSKIIKR